MAEKEVTYLWMLVDGDEDFVALTDHRAIRFWQHEWLLFAAVQLEECAADPINFCARKGETDIVKRVSFKA